MSRGFAAIGLVRPKYAENVGGVLRAARVYSAAMIALEGARAEMPYGGDTTKAWRHMPVLRGDDVIALAPYGAVPVAVEVIDGAQELPRFKHPESAYYIFGPEAGSLCDKHLSACQHIVSIPTAYCMNLAATVNVVLYDRLAKQRNRERWNRIWSEVNAQT